MNKEKKEKRNNLTIEEAVERLTSIVEMDDNYAPEVLAMENPEDSVSPSIMSWISDVDPISRLELIRELFDLILHHVKAFYKKEFRYTTNQQATEGLKAIMLVVGEAAKKMDQNKEFFIGKEFNSVTELPEYKKLQDFYLSRIARTIDEGLLSRWIMGLTHKMDLEEEEKVNAPTLALLSSKHVFVDMDSVKKDADYELFFIRKENGTRFFSPRLIRNIKLVCDFGNHLGENIDDDPLESIGLWRNEILCHSAKDIVQSISPQIKAFYIEASRDHENDLPVYLGKALMALMLCSNKHHLAPQSGKSSLDYFIDFQDFLGQALRTREYERLVAYPPTQENKKGQSLLDLTHALCQAFFLTMKGYQDVESHIERLLKEATQEKAKKKEQKELSEILAAEYAALSTLLKHHANGPLIKILEVLEEGNYHSFDPLHQGNIPTQLFALDALTKHIVHVRLPCPTHQEYVNKVSVNEEFKGFLRALQSDISNQGRFVLFNFQDRTSWREHHRSIMVEELQKHRDFSNQLTVITLPKDTEFYHQEAPYHADNRVEVFLQHFKKHMKDENCGFYFPEAIKKPLFSGFINDLLVAVHQEFFGGRNTLPKERRKDFIEIVYLFLELKIIELLKPEGFSFSCKDGVDCGPAASALLLIFLELLKEPELSPAALKQLEVILFGPALMVRERMIRSDQFKRMLHALKEIELRKNEVGWEKFAESIRQTFGGLFKTDLLNAKIELPAIKVETK